MTQAPTTTLSSSERLVQFLAIQDLHKKDFAEMIGVTLSYVYSLIDGNDTFSSRLTTLERIAVVMDVSPKVFPEYRMSEEPRRVDAGIQYFQERQQAQGLSNVQFLKHFPRNKRVMIVDMWRGAQPLPLDWAELVAMALVLDTPQKDIYPFWEARMRQYVSEGGLDPIANIGLTQAIFQGVRQYLNI